VMGQYVAALGVAQSGGCNFCHVQGDRASDEKPEKVTARMMIVMVNDINSKMSGASLKTVVTCYTCHRGKTMPETAPAAGLPLRKPTVRIEGRRALPAPPPGLTTNSARSSPAHPHQENAH